jgi:hypothetical protein
VQTLNWEDRSTTVTPDGALEQARQIGTNLGRQLRNQGWVHIHFIAHSAGSDLIQSATEYLKGAGVTPSIHETFLDPYLGIGYAGRGYYGLQADWADNYFSHDRLTRSFTEGALAHAHNVEVTWLDPDRDETPIRPPPPNTQCGTEAFSTHPWPHEFYQETVSPSANGYGFPLSKEGGGWNNRDQYPANSDPIELGGVHCFDVPDQPIAPNPSLDFGQVPHGNSNTGTLQFIPSGFNATTGGSQSSTSRTFQGKPGRGQPYGGTETYAPVWVTVAIDTPTNINFIQFDAEFTSADGATGLLTVYWNDQEIGTIDERNVEPGVQTYTFGIPSVFTDHNNSLGFRLDQFSDVASSVSVTNVITGFAGTGAIPALAIDKNQQGDQLLTVSGTLDGYYVIEASTDLATWNPIITVNLTAGTPVSLFDADAQNFTKRFYRAVAP